jgi:metallo-beta-lactamase class B
VEAPRRDIDTEDGAKISLGGTSVTVLLTPGHTPGTTSMIFPVTDHGVKHVVSIYGGYGIPGSVAGVDTSIAGVQHLLKVAREAGADVVLSTHPFFDATFEKTQALAAKPRKNGDPNPWVLGQSGYIRSMMATVEVLQCVRAIYVEAASAQH